MVCFALSSALLLSLAGCLKTIFLGVGASLRLAVGKVGLHVAVQLFPWRRDGEGKARSVTRVLSRSLPLRVVPGEW